MFYKVFNFWVIINFWFFASCTPVSLGDLEISSPSGVLSDTLAIPVSDVGFYDEQSYETYVHRQSRQSAVRVQVEYPGMTVYGSGTYMKWRGHTVVVTAAHLFAFSSPKTLDSEAVIVTPSEKVFGKLVYVDEYVDIAVFAVPKLQSRKAATFNRAQSFEIGDPVVYSGFPGPNNLLTFDGSITGAGHTTDIVIQSFAWPGSSGSGVYNSKGELVGIVVSIMVGGGPSGSQLLGSLVYVAPANLIDSAYLFQNLQKLKRTRNAGF